MQADRILEFWEDILMDQERTNTFREHLQVVNGCLTRVVRDVSDRIEGINNECGELFQGVIDANAPVEGQGDEAPTVGDAASSTHERKSAGSIMD